MSRWGLGPFRRTVMIVGSSGFCMLGLAGCDRPADTPVSATSAPNQRMERELDARNEVLNQTREVIRYVEEEQRLKEQELGQRGLSLGK